MRKIKKIICTAGVLNRCEQIANIKGFRRLRPYDNIFAQPMIIKYERLGTKLPWYIGELDTFHADWLVADDKAMAIFGKPESDDLWGELLDLKQVPHITLGTAKDIAPVYSNGLLMSKATHISLHMKLDIRCGAYCIMEDAKEPEWIFGLEDLIER